MSKLTSLVLILVCLFGLTYGQEATTTSILTEEDLANAELMKVLNNYFGCRVWQDGVCVECSERYYFNNEGICCEVKPECRIFNV